MIVAPSPEPALHPPLLTELGPVGMQMLRTQLRDMREREREDWALAQQHREVEKVRVARPTMTRKMALALVRGGIVAVERLLMKHRSSAALLSGRLIWLATWHI